MPRYNYSGGPADWAMAQQGRRDDQIRDILNMMMQTKNFNTEQGWKQKNFDYQASQDAANSDIDRRYKEAAISNYAEVPYHKPEQTDEEKLAYLEQEEKIKAKYRPKGGQSSDDLEKEYRKARAEIEKRYSLEEFKATADYQTEVARLRRDPKLRMVDPASPYQNPYEVAVLGAKSAWEKQKESIPQMKQREIDALDIEYGKRSPTPESPDNPDQYGFVIGQKKPDKSGKAWVYMGNNQWSPNK
jgi:hypothetical protein